MDSGIDLNSTWEDCERHIDQLARLVHRVALSAISWFYERLSRSSVPFLTHLVGQILSGDEGVQQVTPSMLERE